MGARRRGRLIVAIVVAVLVGCGGDDDDAAATSTSVADHTTTTTELTESLVLADTDACRLLTREEQEELTGELLLVELPQSADATPVLQAYAELAGSGVPLAGETTTCTRANTEFPAEGQAASPGFVLLSVGIITLTQGTFDFGVDLLVQAGQSDISADLGIAAAIELPADGNEPATVTIIVDPTHLVTVSGGRPGEPDQSRELIVAASQLIVAKLA